MPRPAHTEDMLNMHNLQTHVYVCFVDLVPSKSLDTDTANHKLLVKELKKYGAPPKFCLAVEQMHMI